MTSGDDFSVYLLSTSYIPRMIIFGTVDSVCFTILLDNRQSKLLNWRFEGDSQLIEMYFYNLR